jgi:hypothetical protein
MLESCNAQTCLPRSVHATQSERSRRLPGDAFITEPIGTLTHAVTIHGNPSDIWPWLIQMGAGSRAGWYSYDFLDNGGRTSATRIVPELQRIVVGTLFPALPGVNDGFLVLEFATNRSLTIGWPSPAGAPLVTWTFVLEQQSDRVTRLIVRARGARSYRFHGLPWWLSKPVARIVHYVMQRRQLLGIAGRVESSKATPVDAHRPARLERQAV